MAVQVLVQDAGVEELALADGGEGVLTELVGPGVEEGQVAGEAGAVLDVGGDLEANGNVVCGVASAVAGQHVQGGDIGAGGQGVLVDAEAGGGEVVAQLAVEVEDVGVAIVDCRAGRGTAGDGDLGLERR